MAVVKARSPVVWIRRLLLTAGLIGVMVLALLIVAYQFGKTGLQDESDDNPAAASTDESTLTAGEGFAYVQTIEGRQVFHIQAEKSLQDRQDTTYLETVILDIFREDGETYRVTSDHARVNESTWEARLEGNVVVSGWGDLVLEARAFDLRQGGQLLLSHGAVQFRYPPDLEGRGTALRIDRRNDMIALSGGVHIRSTPGSATPLRLDCERLVYKRGESLIRAIDDAYVKFGGQELWARAINISLHEDQRTLRALRAVWDVAGMARSLTDFGGETQVSFGGQSLQLEPDPVNQQSTRVKLEGSEDTPAVLKLVDAEGMGRILRARFFEGETVEGKPVSIDGYGKPLRIDEFLDLPEPFPLRQVCADRVSARFLANGDLSQIQLDDQVELWNRDLYLSGGSRALLEIESGKVQISGPLVELFSERGDLAAPSITYTRDRGLIRAESGVRASLEPGSASALERTPFGQGRGPIRVESSEAFYTTDPPAFTFMGSVRAWRDQNLLLAEQLRGDQAKDEMSASGGIRTLWFTAPREADDSATAEPIEVTADLLTYRRTDSTVVYSGNVEIDQQHRSLTCGELEVELDSNGREAKRMTCRDEVLMLDRGTETAGERRVSGDLAVYTVAAGQIEIFGQKVTLVDSSQNRIEGKYLIYELDTDKVAILSRTPATAGSAR